MDYDYSNAYNAYKRKKNQYPIEYFFHIYRGVIKRIGYPGWLMFVCYSHNR